jgi:hypothetical protein
MDFEIIYKMVKYLACGAMMFFILKYIVNDKMPLVDIALISVIAMLIFAVVENSYSLVRGGKEDKLVKNDAGGQMCQSFCAMKEHMGNMSPEQGVPTMNIPNQIAHESAAAMVSPNISEKPSAMSETAMMNSIINSMKMDNMKMDNMKMDNMKMDNMSQDSSHTVSSSEQHQVFPKNIISEEESIIRPPEIRQEMRHEFVSDSEESSRFPAHHEEKIEYVKIPQEMREQTVKVSDHKLSDYDRFQKRFAEIVDERQQHNDDYTLRTGKIDRNDDASYTVNYQRRSPDIIASGSRTKDGVMKESEARYNVVSYHTVPPNLNKGSFEYGYSFLPPANWYPTPPFPPVCVAEKQCPVCPVYTTGTNVELKEWDSSRRITAPDEINVRYVEEKLNSGR